MGGCVHAVDGIVTRYGPAALILGDMAVYNHALVRVSSCPIITTMAVYIYQQLSRESQLDKVVCVYMYSFLIITMVVEPAVVCIVSRNHYIV